MVKPARRRDDPMDLPLLPPLDGDEHDAPPAPDPLDVDEGPVSLDDAPADELRDDVLEPREARYTLRVRDGAATVEPGGSGAVAVDVRGLAALYSGHMAPAELAARGYLDGDARKASALAAVFAGPTSWMNEIGFSAPSAQQRSMTSWQRRSISALSRWTEAKSRSS